MIWNGGSNKQNNVLYCVIKKHVGTNHKAHEIGKKNAVVLLCKQSLDISIFGPSRRSRPQPKYAGLLRPVKDSCVLFFSVLFYLFVCGLMVLSILSRPRTIMQEMFMVVLTSKRIQANISVGFRRPNRLSLVSTT